MKEPGKDRLCLGPTCPHWCHRRPPPGRCRHLSERESDACSLHLLTAPRGRTTSHGKGLGLTPGPTLPSPSTWVGLLISGQLSQASPTPSSSLSVCSGFGTLGQLSSPLGMPTRHAGDTSLLLQQVTLSPGAGIPHRGHPLALSCLALPPPPSHSQGASPTQATPVVLRPPSRASFPPLGPPSPPAPVAPSPSTSLSHASPSPLPSVSFWSLLGTLGQLSQASPKESVSEFCWSLLGNSRQLSWGETKSQAALTPLGTYPHPIPVPTSAVTLHPPPQNPSHPGTGSMPKWEPWGPSCSATRDQEGTGLWDKA